MAKLPRNAAAFIERLREDPQTEGILLFGSWARGNNHAESDVDLLVVSKREDTRRHIEKGGESNLEVVFTSEAAAKSFWEANRDDCADLWSYAKVLFDREGTIERLKIFGLQLIRAGKPVLAEWQIQHSKFDCYDSIQCAERTAPSDPYTAQLLLYDRLSSLTELYFNLRAQWTPPPKQRMAVFRRTDSTMCSLIEAAIAAAAGSQLKEFAKSIRSVADHVFNIS